MRIGDAAQRLGISTDTVREWVRKGLLVASYTPTGQLVFDASDVEAVRSGNRRPTTALTPTSQAMAAKADERPRTPAWKELAPWQAELEAERAALALDELRAQRERRDEEREEERCKRGRIEAQTAQRAAEIRRLQQVKLEVFRLLYIDAEARAEVAAGIDAFATPEQVPGWLSHAEQFDLVAKKARQIIERVRAEERKRRTEAQPSAGLTAIARWPLPLSIGWPPSSPPAPHVPLSPQTPPSPATLAPTPPARPIDPPHGRPSTVAEALRSRGV